ncbi:MAG TPA: hypothetical protein VEB68_02010 [Croceibacterium sp.]|nr:hypothetical protein [Croceibacterium sp.]
MKRAIITPPVLAPAALAELKDWLAITTPRDDAVITALLRAALELCEAFTGQMPLAATCEEVLPAAACWQTLATRPVQAVTGVWAIPDDGERVALAPADYALELEADGAALVRVLRAEGAKRVAVRFTAGMAAGWAELPDGLRHGVLRLAAHHYRRRDLDADAPVPPAAVAALWRPWRRMRVA